MIYSEGNLLLYQIRSETQFSLLSSLPVFLLNNEMSLLLVVPDEMQSVK